jgi:ankyrin repeat protein
MIDTKENNCNQDVVQRILEAGADLNARTEWGDTPSHYAAQYSCYEVLRQLIDQGAEVHKPIECKCFYLIVFI